MYNNPTKITHGETVYCVLNLGSFIITGDNDCKTMVFERDISIGDSLMLDESPESTFERVGVPVVASVTDCMQAVCIVKNAAKLQVFPDCDSCSDWGVMLDNEWYMICVCEIIKPITVVNDRYMIEIGW